MKAELEQIPSSDRQTNQLNDLENLRERTQNDLERIEKESEEEISKISESEDVENRGFGHYCGRLVAGIGALIVSVVALACAVVPCIASCGAWLVDKVLNTDMQNSETLENIWKPAIFFTLVATLAGYKAVTGDDLDLCKPNSFRDWKNILA